MAHDKRTEDGAETRKCAKCGSQKLRLILRFLDPRTGNHVRLYKCECGERVWEEESSGGDGSRFEREVARPLPSQFGMTALLAASSSAGTDSGPPQLAVSIISGPILRRRLLARTGPVGRV
jgi:hypothetical protein